MISGSYDMLILFLFFLSLAVFSDSKIRRLKSNPKKGGGRKTDNQNLVGKRYLLQSRKEGKQTSNKREGCYERTRPRKGVTPARAHHGGGKSRHEGKSCYPKPSQTRREKEEGPSPEGRKPGPKPNRGSSANRNEGKTASRETPKKMEGAPLKAYANKGER